MTLNYNGVRVTNFARRNIGWTVGNYCNAACGHCYSWKIRKNSKAFLCESDVDHIIDQLRRLEVGTVNLGGNEPIYTHGPDIKNTLLPYIIRALTKANIPVGLTTNGISFAYLERHDRDALMMINDIDFSLDSPFEREHNLNRRTKLYRLAIRAIRRSLEIGIDCSVVTCGMRRNFDQEHLSAFLALTKLLGSEFRVNILKPVEPVLLAEMPTSEQFYEGFSFLIRNTRCLTLGESCLTAVIKAGAEGCPCGTTSFRINGKTDDGKIPVSPCVYSHNYMTGDLLRDDIFDIIASPSFAAFANRRTEIPRACRDSDCGFLDRCRGGCASRSLFVYGNLDSKDPYCPQEYMTRHGSLDLPEHLEIGCDNAIRVHDNYLCTWIGKVNPSFCHDKYTSVEHYLQGTRYSERVTRITGCRQVAASQQLSQETSLSHEA